MTNSPVLGARALELPEEPLEPELLPELEPPLFPEPLLDPLLDPLLPLLLLPDPDSLSRSVELEPSELPAPIGVTNSSDSPPLGSTIL